MANILIIEDELPFAEEIKELLVRDSHGVQLVADAKAVMHTLCSKRFDAVILNIAMRNVDGVRLCKQYRSRGGNARIIMMSNNVSTEEKETGLDGGADDFVVKPVHPKELAARVRALMRRSLVVINQSVRLGDLVIDEKRHFVSRGGAEIRLQPQEFTLLEFLSREPNHVFTTDELIKRVWFGNSSVDTVRTHIKTLRKKIDLPELRPLIKTVHGVGYKLDTREEFAEA